MCLESMWPVLFPSNCYFKEYPKVPCRTHYTYAFPVSGILMYLTQGHPRAQGGCRFQTIISIYFILVFCLGLVCPCHMLLCCAEKPVVELEQLTLLKKNAQQEQLAGKICTYVSILHPQPKPASLHDAHCMVLTCSLFSP